MSDFTLTQVDKNSHLWRRLKRHLEDKRAELRAQNDNITLDERQTAAKRGRISELTELLALDEAPGVEP